jgi:hypothetical protein
MLHFKVPVPEYGNVPIDWLSDEQRAAIVGTRHVVIDAAPSPPTWTEWAFAWRCFRWSILHEIEGRAERAPRSPLARINRLVGKIGTPDEPKAVFITTQRYRHKIERHWHWVALGVHGVRIFCTAPMRWMTLCQSSAL